MKQIRFDSLRRLALRLPPTHFRGVKPHFREDLVKAAEPRLALDTLELIPQGEWIPAKEAATALGMERGPFLASYCDPKAPRLVIWERRGPKGGRRVLVQAESLRQEIQRGLRTPA